MNKINQFTFSDEPEYILEQAMAVFEENEYVNYDSGIFIISIENKSFIDFIEKRFGVKLYCTIRTHTNWMYNQIMLTRDYRRIPVKTPLPIFAVIDCDVITGNRKYIATTVSFDNELFKYGIEAYYMTYLEHRLIEVKQKKDIL